MTVSNGISDTCTVYTLCHINKIKRNGKKLFWWILDIAKVHTLLTDWVSLYLMELSDACDLFIYHSFYGTFVTNFSFVDVDHPPVA